jgi:hypothetical protein
MTKGEHACFFFSLHAHFFSGRTAAAMSNQAVSETLLCLSAITGLQNTSFQIG